MVNWYLRNCHVWCSHLGHSVYSKYLTNFQIYLEMSAIDNRNVWRFQIKLKRKINTFGHLQILCICNVDIIIKPIFDGFASLFHIFASQLCWVVAANERRRRMHRRYASPFPCMHIKGGWTLKYGRCWRNQRNSIKSLDATTPIGCGVEKWSARIAFYNKTGNWKRPLCCTCSMPDSDSLPLGYQGAYNINRYLSTNWISAIRTAAFEAPGTGAENSSSGASFLKFPIPSPNLIF